MLSIIDINVIYFTKLCNLLNINDDWIKLAGALGYNILEIETIRRKSDPTNNLLLKYDMTGATPQNLITVLNSINYIHAAQIVQDFLDSYKANNMVNPLPNNDRRNTPPQNLPNNIHCNIALEKIIRNRNDLAPSPPSYSTAIGEPVVNVTSPEKQKNLNHEDGINVLTVSNSLSISEVEIYGEGPTDEKSKIFTYPQNEVIFDELLGELNLIESKSSIDAG